MTRNTSQDPDYVGEVGHEKKFHKTHFGGLAKTWKSTESQNEWVRIAPGKFILLPKKRDNAGDEPEEGEIK